MMAGTENFYEDNEDTLKNDVWSSDDGIHWKLETECATWPKRTHAQAVVFDGKMWIMGGGAWHPETIPRHDIWCSEDGVDWTCATPAAPRKPRMWFSRRSLSRPSLALGWVESGRRQFGRRLVFAGRDRLDGDEVRGYLDKAARALRLCIRRHDLGRRWLRRGPR